MSAAAFESRVTRLFLLLGAFFVTNALLAEFIGVKIFSFERTLGAEPVAVRLGAVGPLSFDLTAGVLLWPVVFVLTDIVNEYYGKRGVRLLSLIAVGMILYAFLMVSWTMRLEPADFWRTRETAAGPLDMERAFDAVFGQGRWIIAGSLIAFLVSQLVDVWTFHALKRRTGERWIWLRATGSTVVSQLVDSFVVLFVAFYLSGSMPLARVLAICTLNYAYKFGVALLMTPVVYLLHGLVERWLGKDLAGELRARAAAG